MKEIVERLHENRQVELAKSILESAGYRVEKIEESDTKLTESLYSFSKASDVDSLDHVMDPDLYDSYEGDIAKKVVELLGSDPASTYMVTSEDYDAYREVVDNIKSKEWQKIGSVDGINAYASDRYAEFSQDGVHAIYFTVK